jgi:hypothetical protein
MLRSISFGVSDITMFAGLTSRWNVSRRAR